MKKYKRPIFTGESSGCIILTIFMAFYFAVAWLICLWTDKNLDFWLSYFKGETVDVPMWLSFVTSVVLSPICLGANIVAEIAKYFI